MILSCQNISKTFVDNTVLENISFHIEDHEKAAIVGINGAGKTTLLRIITGQLNADTGLVTLAKDKSLGYLAQDAAVDSKNTIYDELLSVKQDLIALELRMRELERQMHISAESGLEEIMRQYTLVTHEFENRNGYAYKSLVVGVLKGLGFTEDEFAKNIGTLSGGQKTRVALGKLLLQEPDIILLDEPTNHLDMQSIGWLENYLLNYKGAVVIVSHDRYFIDRIATKIIELDQSKAITFTGNYTDYGKKKEQLRQAALNAYLNQQKEIRHQQEVIEKLRSFNREKSIKRAESREKMLNKIDVLDKPSSVQTDMKLKLTPKKISGNDVLMAEHLCKAYGNHILFEDVNFQINRGEHVAIIGDNGTGKSTILKIINKLVSPDAGIVRLGSNVEIGYYDQDHQVLHAEKSLFDEISDAYPHLTNTEIRNVLAAFLFTGDDVFKKISSLSGGERGRVSLAKLMLSNANLLILDEPTNHLDIMSKEILEDALSSYEGTVLYVSHDRYFINRTAHRILDLTNQTLMDYNGNYDYYLEKRDIMMNLLKKPEMTTGASTSNIKNETDKKSDWKAQKEEQAKQRKKENDLKRCEEQIAQLEAELQDIESEMCDPTVATQMFRLQELTYKQQELKLKLDNLYEQWETLAE